MGYRRLETLLDVARKGYWIELQCPCGHKVKHNPMVVLKHLSRRGASIRLNQLHQSMKCGKCGGREFKAEHCQGPEIWSR